MKKKYFLIILSISSLILVLITFYLFWSAKNKILTKESIELINHNKFINNITPSIYKIIINGAPENYETGAKVPYVEIENPNEIQTILKLLLIENFCQNTNNFHKCHGQIKMQLVTKEKIYHISYDHSRGIYPLSEDNLIKLGFVDLPKLSCSQLNKFLENKGFTKYDIDN